MKPDLRITMTPTNTVFTGAANVHRFDGPSPREVAQYVRGLFGPDPGGAVIQIAANPEDLDQFEQAMSGYDVTIAAERLEVEVDPPTEEHPAITAEDLAPRRAWWPFITLGAAVVVVAAICGFVLFRFLSTPSSPTTALPTGATSATATVLHSQPTASRASTSPAPSAASEPTAVRLAQDGLAIELPPGFQLAQHEQGWMATGADPDMRVLISAENRYTLPPEQFVSQLLSGIERDPELTLVEHNLHAVTYRETAPGGAETLWRTWAHDSCQLFVACQTRQTPSRVQQATCQMAFDTAEFTPPTGEG
ncbi:type VII secretion-associated protein [Corynebacterium sp. NML130628]|uniref:type VII secretion-associated protein n=1 Tax=Corynebacterium sp. NML130628 TaxID=1906333 RepID=UPI0008FB57CA|nr:type VII secretion-associated protein [Corynebacterium sp. NML130628]OIR40292.1 type VII secretion-associated protein [Corynebacterium sp. NML130628]